MSSTGLTKLVAGSVPALALLLSVLGATAPTQAESVAERAAQRGYLVLGYTVASPPMSYLGPEGEPIGYTIDICRAIANELGQAIVPGGGDTGLGIELMRMELDTRTQLLADGVVDLLCNGTSNTPARQAELGFSPTIYVIETRLAVNAAAPFQGLDDLRGGRVAVSAGSTAETTLKSMANERGLAVVVAHSNDAAFAQLKLGWAQAVALDDVVLDGLIATSTQPQRYRLLPQVLGREAIGIAFAKGDDAFAGAVKRATRALVERGEVEQLYRKWLEGPIPPFGRVIGKPMPQQLKTLLEAGDDRPLAQPVP